MKSKLIMVAACLAVAARAQTNPSSLLALTLPVQLVEVLNPTNRPVPVVLEDVGATNVYPSFAMGFGTGLVICGFGWVLRLVRRVAGPDNS